MGWRVIRIWEHDIETRLNAIVDDIYSAVELDKPPEFQILNNQ